MGSTNEVVYPVKGGMEEWGYAASWFNRYNKVPTVPSMCRNEVPVVITEGSNRCLVFLVETETKKKPPKATLGNNENVFLVSNKTRDFWIPVLMRQITVVLDVLRPYSMIVGVSSEKVRWNVGGCFEVDETFVMVFRYSEAFHRLAANQKSSVNSDLTDSEYDSLLRLVETEKPLLVTSVLKGVSPYRQTPKESYFPGVPENQLIFESSIELGNVDAGENVVIIAVSRVDKFMTRVPENENPIIPPQSLFVSLRTNASWIMRNEKSGRELRGREKVLSRPVEVSSAVFSMRGKRGNLDERKNGSSKESLLNLNENENWNDSNTQKNDSSTQKNDSNTQKNESGPTAAFLNSKLNDTNSFSFSPSSFSSISDFKTDNLTETSSPFKLVYFRSRSSQTVHFQDPIYSNLDSISLFFVFFPLLFFTFVLLASIFCSVF